ncbi:putative T7SS-secreted protein [Nocardia sp. NPDC058379]|uniref:putative T7SS-secreted protein n=1 Tax=unclassified Nocardia TaxID=2637762 RepID=UPI0036621855
MGIGDFLNDLGDKIEDGLESATEKVGQVYNTVLDAESKVAKAVGADGLSNFLDDLGDKIVDATGGSVPEKELGETTDPKELIRGDVAKINEVAEHLGTIGTAIDQTGDALRKIDVADWSGSAASAFHDEYSKQPKLWWDGADAMGKAKTALAAWSAEVTAAQAKASDAIAKWEAADREERDRKNEWNAKSDEDRKGKNLTDTWTDIRNEARAILTGARTQRDNAANSAVAAIAAATETAPTEPPFLSRWGSNFEDLSAALDQAKLNFSSGLLTSLTGMVQFVRSISPIDAYNATHPAEYLSKMSDLGTGMVLAAADPKATASAMLSGFKTNPSEALGALTGDALMTVATGGAGGAAKAGANVVDKASEAARLGNAGRNVIDDTAGAASRNAPHDVPEAPKTQPAAHAPENPAAPANDAPAANPSPEAPTNPAGHGGDPDVPAPDNLRANDPESPKLDDNAPAPRDGSPESPAPATTPESPGAGTNPDAPPVREDGAPHNGDADNGPEPDPEVPNDRGDGKPESDSPGAASPDPDNAPPTNPDNAAPHTDDAGNHQGDTDGDTQPGAHNGPDSGAPNNSDNLIDRDGNDRGGDGKPSVGDDAQTDGPAKTATDDQTPKAGDPVKIATGDFLLPLTDIDLPGVLRLALKRAHHSNYRFGRWFGPSWSATLDMRVVVDDDCVTVVFEDGMLLAYPHAEVGVGVEPITGGQRWKLTRTDTGGYRLWDPDRELVWHFAPEPTLDGLDTLLGNFAISAITDRHHNRIRFHYNDNGDPIEVTHSGGYRVVLDSADGRVTAISVAGELDGVETSTPVREFGYENGDLTTVTNGVGGVTRFDYDDEHRMLSWTDSNGSWVTNTYDESGRVVSQRGTNGVFDAEYEYLEFGNGTGRLTRMTDSRGAVTGYGFDSDLRLRDLRAPDGGHRHIDYNAARKPLSVSEPDGATTTYNYTADGDVAVITRPDGRQITIDYAYPNRPSTVTNADGTTQHREWDKAGNLVAVIDPAGARTEYRHHEGGAVAEIRDPDGARTQIDVDLAGLPVKVTDPYGASTEIRRDTFGRPIQVTNQLGAVTSYEWTPEGRPARRVDPDGYAESWTYDGENNLLTHTNRAGHITSYAYGGFDKVSTRTDPDGSVHRYLYNTERALTAVINPLGQRWTYEYDLAGRLEAETDYTGATTRYTYTSTGRVATVTPATGVTRHHTYDNLGNLLDITADTGEYIRNTYDPAGRVLTAVNGTAEAITHTLRFTYTPTGQVATEQLDDQPPMRNDYDHRSRRIRRTTPSGAVTTWNHDTLNRVASLDADGERITFNYDPASRLTGWRIGEVQIDRTFTPTNQLASQTVTGFPSMGLNLDFGDTPPRPDPFVIRHDEYTYCTDGFLAAHTTTRSDTAPTHRRYDLDSIGRVTAIADNGTLSETYSYDALSNITSALTPNTPTSSRDRREYRNNLLVRDGRTQFHYDSAGRLIRKVTRDSYKPIIWHYRYNAFGQLTDIYTPEKEWWHYSYDPVGRRTEKQNIGRDNQNISSTTSYHWDGTKIVSESAPDSRSTTLWTYQPGTFRPILQLCRAEERNLSLDTMLEGHPGTLSELVDPNTCTITARGQSDFWGQTIWSGSRTTRIRFPGQYHDIESGLHYSLFRTYDPSSGRFLTSDPLGLIPADNPNSYPRNTSRWADPLGLTPDVYSGNTNGGSWSPEQEPYLYRGVPHQGPLDPEEFQRMYQNALDGIAEPRGGPNSAQGHVGGQTESPYTSWTTDYDDVALDAATELPGPGVVMRIPNADGPDYHRVGGINYPYAESEVTIMGTVTGADVRVLGGPWRSTR